MPSPARRTWPKFAAVGLVVVVGLVAHRLGVLERVADPTTLTQTLVDLGAWGYLAFVLAYAVFQPFGVPGTAFLMVAPLVWSWPVAFVVSMTGTLLASVVGFSFARFVARDWVSTRIPKRFVKYERALDEHAFRTVFVLRFVFWMPPMLHAFFGVSNVRFWTHFWGSFVGYLVPVFVMSYFGKRFFEFVKNTPVEVWIAIAAALVVGVVGYVVVARRRRESTPERAP